MAAREDYGRRGYTVRYYNVKQDASRLEEMLRHTNGARKVPTILEDGDVKIGFGGS